MSYMSYSPDQKKSSFRQWFTVSVRLSFFEKLLFTKHLHAMLSAGLTITESLDILIEQAGSKRLRSMLSHLKQSVEGGQTLSQSLGQFSHIFEPVYLHMIEVGEEGGNLDHVFGYLNKLQTKEYNLRKKIFSAFIYPVIILFVMTGLSIFLIVFIIPKIAGMFASFNAELPLATRLLISLSHILKKSWYLIIIMVTAAIISLRWLGDRPVIKSFLDRVILRLPIFGTLSRNINLARLSRMLATLIESGVPLIKSLEITATTLGNSLYQKKVAASAKIARQGITVTEAFSQDKKLFPPLICRMIAVGEQTGSLGKTCKNLAILYEKEVDNATKNLSTLLEPILLIVMAAAVGGIALSIITPIYKITSLLQR